MSVSIGSLFGDDQSTSFEWEISEWTSDNTQAAGKRKRGHHTNVEDTEST